MSTRFGYTQPHFPESIPYHRSYIPIRITPNRKNLEPEKTEPDEEDCVEVPEDSHDTEEVISQSSYYEDDPETDNSIEDEQYLDPSMREEESSSDIEGRQLSYVSIPSLLLSSESGHNLSPGDKRKSFLASPAHSFDSVAMDLESDHEDEQNDEEPSPSEDVEDESSQQEDEDFVNVRVKVQKQLYPAFSDKVKVTVSVEPPSEVDENISEASDVSKSEGDSDAEESDNLGDSESINNDNENREMESDNSGGENVSDSEAEEEQEIESESGIGEESEVSKSDKLGLSKEGLDTIAKNTGKVTDTFKVKSEKLELAKEGVDAIAKRTEKVTDTFKVTSENNEDKYTHTIELLDDALKAEQAKRATDNAATFIKQLTPSSTPKKSPLKTYPHESNGKNTKDALLSPMRLIQSNLPIQLSPIKSLAENIGNKSQESISLVETASEISKSLPQIPKTTSVSPRAQPKIPKSQPLPSKVTQEIIKPPMIITSAIIHEKPTSLSEAKPDIPRPSTPKSQPGASKSEPVLPRSPKLQPAISKPQPVAASSVPTPRRSPRMGPVIEKPGPITSLPEETLPPNIQTSTPKSQPGTSKSEPIIRSPRLQPAISIPQLPMASSVPTPRRSPRMGPVIKKSELPTALSETPVSNLESQIPKSDSTTPIPEIPNSESLKTVKSEQIGPNSQSVPPLVTPSLSSKESEDISTFLPSSSNLKSAQPLKFTDLLGKDQQRNIKAVSYKTSTVGFEDDSIKPSPQKSQKPTTTSQQEGEDKKPSPEETTSEKTAGDDVEDYLSVYADSAETTDEDDDENTLKKQSKRQTLEEQEELKAAKDKLVELWKLNITEDVSDLDEGFSTILDDMLSELKQGPVQLPTPANIQTLDASDEAPQESTEENGDKEEVTDDKEDDEVEEVEEASSIDEVVNVLETDGIEKAKKLEGIQEIEEVEGVKNPNDIPKAEEVENPQENNNQNLEVKIEEVKPKTVEEPEIRQFEEGSLDDSDPPDSPLSKSTRKWNNSTEIASALSQYLVQIKTITVEDNVTEIIPLLTHLLLGSRKNKSEHDLSTLIASMSAVRVLCDRFYDIRVTTGERGLRNVDLSWLLRVLCKISADPESKVKPEASFTLARLVKAAGPELITRPIYFLLVMENEGYGHKKGAQGAKTKAAALDTLTYAMLTFPKEEFGDLEEIARWVCLVLFHSQRRVRQSALECLAVIGDHLGNPDKAISLFRRLIVREKEFELSGSSSDGMGKAIGMTGFRTRAGLGIFDVSAITAFSTRLRKHILPLPSSNGLIEYGVKVPTGKELIEILTKLQDIEENEFDASSSADSFISVISNVESSVMDPDSENESIRMSDLERTARDNENNPDKVLGDNSNNKKPSNILDENQEADVITADVAYVLAGKGRVCNQEVVIQDDNLKLADEEIPEQQQQLLDEEAKEKEKKEKAKKKKKKHRKRRDRDLAKDYRLDNDSDENDDILRESYIGLSKGTNSTFTDDR